MVICTPYVHPLDTRLDGRYDWSGRGAEDTILYLLRLTNNARSIYKLLSVSDNSAGLHVGSITARDVTTEDVKPDTDICQSVCLSLCKDTFTLL
jgi:hypothetical protein